MKITREYNFNDLYENSWSGAIDTLDTIIKNDMENELMEHLEEIFDNQIPTETEPVQEDTVIKSAPVVIEKSDFQGTMEDNVLDLYRKKLVGTWHVSKDMTFKFSADGSYAGFFDSNLSDVNNYTYQCGMQEESPVLYIYNEEKTSMVSYTLILNDEDNVVLHFEAAGIDLELKKEKK